MRFNPACHCRGKNVSVDCKRASRLHSRFVSTLENHRAQHAHLGLQKPVRIRRFSTLESIGADQLGESVSVMRWRLLYRTHLVQHNAMAAFRELPRSL